MKCNDLTQTQIAYRKFEMILRGHEFLDDFSRENGLVLLLCGPPGAGKTTLGLYLLHEIYKKIERSNRKDKALLLSLVETPEQIAQICDIYNLKFNIKLNNKISQTPIHLVPGRFNAGDVPDLEMIAKAVGLNLREDRLLLVDGVSVLGTQEMYRERLLSFIDQIKKNHLLAILIAEEYREDDDVFLQYVVDGIIKLDVNPNTSSRRLKLVKLRWHHHYLESHAFRLQEHTLNTSPNNEGVLFFPSIACLTEERITNQALTRESIAKQLASFKLTDKSLNELANKNIPKKILGFLKKLKDRRYKGEQEFVNTLKAKLGEKDSETYKDLILNHVNEGAKGLPSGVEGFDQILGFDQGNGEGPFRAGEQALLIGPSGTGIFLFGTQFLEKATSDQRCVYVSFVRSFQEVEIRLRSLSPENEGPECDCLHFGLTGLVLEEMLGAVHNLLEHENHELKITRLFINGISALRCLFDTDEKFEKFLRSFLELLSTFKNVATLISYYSTRVFASYSEIDIPAGEHFSMVVGFNFQEQYNKLMPGIVVLRSTNDVCDNSLKVPVVTTLKNKEDKKYLKYSIDLNAGWSRVGLLGGERERVQGERPFVKLFFENKSEHEVIKDPFKEFAKHYPDDQIFKMLAKQNPQPSHWSFQGYAGAGHSNIKLVELRKYVMDVLREQGVFLNVPEEMNKWMEDSKGFLWHDSTSINKLDVMIPFYADVGVFVYQDEPLREFIKEFKGEEKKGEPILPETWNELIEWVKHFTPKEKSLSPRHLFVIPNTVSDAKNFVSFFFELCWTCGWEFPDPTAVICDKEKAREKSESKTIKVYSREEIYLELRKWVKGPFFENAVSLLKRMVEEGKNGAILNPNEGGHYHESIFSRRWFSKIHLLPEDRVNRAKKGWHAFPFGIAPLPGVTIGGNFLKGISNVDLYSLAIIRAALAPETGWILATSLLEYPVDVNRAKCKRGLPISRERFRSSLIRDNLNSEPPIPVINDKQVSEKKFYPEQKKIFEKYGATLKNIVDPDLIPKKPQFRRTSDIPQFFFLEELLANTLPRLFDDPKNKTKGEKEVKGNILKGIEKIYGSKTTDGKN